MRVSHPVPHPFATIVLHSIDILNLCFGGELLRLKKNTKLIGCTVSCYRPGPLFRAIQHASLVFSLDMEMNAPIKYCAVNIHLRSSWDALSKTWIKIFRDFKPINWEVAIALSGNLLSGTIDYKSALPAAPPIWVCECGGDWWWCVWKQRCKISDLKLLAAYSEDLSSGPQHSNKKPGMAVHTCDLHDRLEEGKTRGSQSS